MGKVKKSVRKFRQKNEKSSQPVKKLKSHKNTAKTGSKKIKNRIEDKKKPEDSSDDKKKELVKDMDLDEFLDGGFLQLGGREEEEGVEQMDDESESSDEDSESGSQDAEPHGQNGDEADEGAHEESDSDTEGPVGQDNVRLKGSIARHRAELERLRQADPEFYEYLQATDQELLAFGADDDEDDDDEDEDDDEEESDEEELTKPVGKKARQETEKEKKKKGDAEPEKEQKKKKKKGGKEEEEKDMKGEAKEEEEEEEEPTTSGRFLVTSDVITRWCAGVLAPGSALGAARSLVRAYRQACHYGDSEEEEGAEHMKLAGAAVYNRLLLFMLKEADGIFRRLLSIKENSGQGGGGGKEVDVTKNARWRKVGPLVKSYLGNSLHLLATLADASMLSYVLRRLRASTNLIVPFHRLAGKLLRTCLNVWGSAEPSPRLQAFLCLRALARAAPAAYLDSVLKGLYRTFVANAKFMSSAAAPHIHFMGACVIEAYGMDPAAAYAQAFAAVRALALALRTALSMKAKDAYKELYCWQGVNCLELWARMLSAHAGEAQLRPLVYPLTQVLLGTCRLVPTPRYFPLRLRLIRALVKLTGSCSTYAPLAPLLLEMLGWAELNRAPAKSVTAAPLPDLTLQLRLSKTLLRTARMQEEVLNLVLELLTEHFSHWSTSIAFPELAHLPLLTLRAFAKASPVERFRRQVRGLVDALERQLVWVGQARDDVDFAPKDVSKVTSFLANKSTASPFEAYAKNVAAAAAARHAARASSSVIVKERRGNEPDDDDDDDDEVSSDDDDGSDLGEREVDVAQANMFRRKAGVPAAAKPGAAALTSEPYLDGVDEDDVVQDFVLSDDEVEEDMETGPGVEDDEESDDDDDDDNEEEEEEEEEEDNGKSKGRVNNQHKGKDRAKGGKRRQHEGKGGGKQHGSNKKQNIAAHPSKKGRRK